MADINGSNGNDALQPFGNYLVIALSGTAAEGVPPRINVLINGVAVLSNVSVTANADQGQTQLISIPVTSGTVVSSVSIQYTNNDQTSNLQDRNVYVSSINLNGHNLPASSATYARLLEGAPYDTIPGQLEMYWGGELRFSGPVVSSATAAAGTNLSVDGLEGIDTVLLGGARSEYSISHNDFGYTVGRAGETLSLRNVERLHFQNGSNVALDLGGGHAGSVASIIAALFGPSFLGVKEYVGIGLNLLDQGITPLQLVALAEGTGLFRQLAGSASNTDFVKLVYQNVVGAPPSAAQLNAYVGLLDSGTFTQASLGLLAAQTAANQVNLVGVVQGGIEFA